MIFHLFIKDYAISFCAIASFLVSISDCSISFRGGLPTSPLPSPCRRTRAHPPSSPGLSRGPHGEFARCLWRAAFSALPSPDGGPRHRGEDDGGWGRVGGRRSP